MSRAQPDPGPAPADPQPPAGSPAPTTATPTTPAAEPAALAATAPTRPAAPTTAAAPAAVGPAAPASTSRRQRGGDLLAYAVFLVLGAWVSAGLWPDPGSWTLADNATDQALFEWFLAEGTRVFSGDFGLLTDRLNAPEGVNLLANTSVLALGVLFAPVTALFGPPVTFAVLLWANLTGTAVAWYLLFSRTMRARPPAAAVGAAFCGFAPGIVSQSVGHLHMSAQWLVPLMVWLVVRLARAATPPDDTDGPADRAPGAATRRGRQVVTSALGLALVVTVQVFIGEEVLFFTAVTLALLSLGYAARRHRYARRMLPGFLAGLLITAMAAGAALAYPLWFQFAGPGSVPNGPFAAAYFSADLASFTAVSPQSLLGTADAARLSTGPAEYTTFFGWPLLVVALLSAGWLWRRPLVSACAVAAVLLAALSLGPELVLNGQRTAVGGPYRLLEHLPVVDSALPMRFALALAPLIATVLVLALDRALRSPRRPVRLLVPAAVLLALVPTVPAPLTTAERPPLPRFITAGHWRSCVPPGGVLAPVPPATPGEPWTMRWPAATGAAFAIPHGFFIGPYGAEGRASIGSYLPPTAQLLADIADTGQSPATITAEQREQARQDVAGWRASCVALAVDTPNAAQLHATLEALLGPATLVADAWTWRVG